MSINDLVEWGEAIGKEWGSGGKGSCFQKRPDSPDWTQVGIADGGELYHVMCLMILQCFGPLNN